jgi:hypothetical protein
MKETCQDMHNRISKAKEQSGSLLSQAEQLNQKR